LDTVNKIASKIWGAVVKYYRKVSYKIVRYDNKDSLHKKTEINVSAYILT